jgi:TonB family protein
VAAHLVALIWLIHSPAAQFISPASIVKGDNGTSVTRLYFPAQLANPGVSEAADIGSREQMRATAARDRLRWTRAAEARKASREQHVSNSDVEAEASSGARANPAPLAGSRFGSLAYGTMSGQEVRPAIRVTGSEPALSNLDGIHEGNEVIELTIDEQGNIIQKSVVQSVGPAADNAVLAALGDWHFLPATRDGVVIPSKQDVYYHFPIRR